MLPFRELEIYDSFMLDGEECDKVSKNKYLVIDELGEVERLEVADPNMMVELLDEEADEEAMEELESRVDDLGIHDEEFLGRYFFSTLLGLVNAVEEAGEEYMETKHLRALADFYLSEESSEN